MLIAWFELVKMKRDWQMHKILKLEPFGIRFFPILLSIVLASCVSVQHTPVPKELVEQAEIPTFSGVRTFADEISPEFHAGMAERMRSIKALRPSRSA